MAHKRMAWETGHYLGVMEGDVEHIYLLGTGIKTLNRTPSPKTATDAYIHEKNASPAITGYENSFTLNYDDIVDDEAVKALQAVADDQLTGDEAEFFYYRVDLLSEGSAKTARRYRVACEAGEETDNATEIVKGTCVLRQVGDLTKGIFDLTLKKFTPTAAAAEK